MRFCICVSGQLRATDESFARLKEISAGHEVQFIFSVWDRIGRKLDGGLNNAQLERMFDFFSFLAIPQELHARGKTLWEFLPVLRRTLDLDSSQAQGEKIRTVIKEYFPDAIIDIESSDLLDLSYDGTGVDLNSKKMLYRIWRCNELKRRVEAASGKFDTVIYMRPDLILENADLDYIQERVSAGKFLVPNWGHAWGKVTEKDKAEDVFAAGNSASMDYFSSLFSRSIALPQRWHNIHAHLFEHLNDSTLDIEDYALKHRFAPGPLITLEQLTSSLTEMRAAAQGWSDFHEITFAVCHAMSVARASGLEPAIEVMRALFLSILSGGRGIPSNYVMVLCELFREHRQIKAAAICALAASHWISMAELWETRGKVAEAAIFEAMAECGSPAKLIPWLLTDLQPDWLSSVLINLLGLNYQDWLQHKFEELVRASAPLTAARAQLAGGVA